MTPPQQPPGGAAHEAEGTDPAAGTRSQRASELLGVRRFAFKDLMRQPPADSAAADSAAADSAGAPSAADTPADDTGAGAGRSGTLRPRTAALAVAVALILMAAVVSMVLVIRHAGPDSRSARAAAPAVIPGQPPYSAMPASTGTPGRAAGLANGPGPSPRARRAGGAVPASAGPGGSSPGSGASSGPAPTGGGSSGGGGSGGSGSGGGGSTTPPPGTLSATQAGCSEIGTGVDPTWSCPFTITAEGGTVSYSLTVTQAGGYTVTLNNYVGTLSAGQTLTITATVVPIPNFPQSGFPYAMVNPGGTEVPFITK